MDDSAFDAALIGSAFSIAGRTGWGGMSVAEAATEAGLPLARARARFPGRVAVLMRFGVMADQTALAEVAADQPVRERLFDMVMRRIDVLQSHREGVLTLLRFLPTDPPLAFLLSRATRRSMRWLLEAAGIPSRGLRGELAVSGLVAVWLWTVRAWREDESLDLSATMAALDKALGRAERAADWVRGRSHKPLEAPEPLVPDTDPPAAIVPSVPPEAPPPLPPSPPQIL